LTFEFALREMISVVNVRMPNFSTSSEKSTITVLISEESCGQSSFLMKLSAIKENSIYIKYVEDVEEQKKHRFSSDIFNTKIIYTSSLSEVVAEARKASEEKKSIFIDADFKGKADQDAKVFCDSLKRSFERVEFFLTLSAIHSEVYNRKVINTLGKLADGINMSFLDKCLNYGAVFNIAYDYPDLPFCFFGTGRVIPDDIESATAERILAGMFRF